MNNGLLSYFVLFIFMFSSPVWLHGQDLSQKSGKSVHNSSSKTHYGYTSENGVRNKNSYNKNHPPGNYNKSYSYHKYKNGNDHKHSGHYKNYYPYYFPPYYVSYGYSYSPDYYLYEDPVSLYGYGTTLGTSLERPSNLEVNRYGGDRDSYEQAGTEGGVPYAEGVYGIYTENYGPSPSEGGAIYIWVDENGVENYVNDLDLVPLRYKDNIRIVGGE